MTPDNTQESAQSLILEELTSGVMPGISVRYGACLAEAASICLEDQNHQIGVNLTVDGNFQQRFPVFWEASSDQAKRSWADPEVTTEHGACGIAALLIKIFTNYTIIYRSRKGTGFDYWLGSKSSHKESLFQGAARLEVSGIRRGAESDIKTRVKKKIGQTKKSDGLLPAYIAVVEFSEPRSRIVER
jgi:hypothetical protein